MTWKSLFEETVGESIQSTARLTGGCVGDVFKCDTAADSYVVKVGTPGSALDIEAQMLRDLSEASPTPHVIFGSDTLLIMTYVENDHSSAESDAARVIGALHDVHNDTFGYPYDTLIGGLPQPNESSTSWVRFFAEQRLNHMARLSVSRGQFSNRDAERVRNFSEQKLAELIPDEVVPTLLHGDLWGGNVLSKNGSIAALIDPAIYFGHYETEIAFIGMFHTFSQTFYDRYPRPLDREFFDVRRDVYNLYPTLVHVALFGGGYVSSVDRTLRRFGF